MLAISNASAVSPASVMRYRINVLKREIAATEQKKQGLTLAIESRKTTLSRLEAQLAISKPDFAQPDHG